MDTQPKIPTLKDSQKPQVKVRGLEAGVTLFDRLKQFKKKDLAFILAGLGTLFMAPLAEHFMMSPETGDGTIKQGFGNGGAGSKGIFDGSGSSPYEPGTNGMAPGGAIGGGADIITPLNVRDPSALVMGPGATQQPPTNSVMPGTPPPTAPVTHSDSDLKDALAASARGVGAGAKAAKALLPVPKIALAGGGSLRGLGVANGSSSAVAGGGPISSAGLAPNRGAQGSNLAGVRNSAGVKGVSRGPTNGDSGYDALKKAADGAANNFNQPRSGSADLAAAASQAVPGGNGGGMGAGGTAATDKADSGNSVKDGKNVGESLEFLKEKAMQEAQIALWAKEQEAGDSKLELLKMRNSIADAVAGSIGTALGTFITCPLQAGSTPATCMGASGPTYCASPNPGGGTPVVVPPAQMVSGGVIGCQNSTGKPGSSAAGTFYLTGTTLMACPPGPAGPQGLNCGGGGKAGDAPGDDPPGSAIDPFSGAAVDPSVSSLVNVCTKAETGMKADGFNITFKASYVQLETTAKTLIIAREAMFPVSPNDGAACASAGTVNVTTPLPNTSGGQMTGPQSGGNATSAAGFALDSKAWTLNVITQLETHLKDTAAPDFKDAPANLKKAEDDRADAETIASAAMTTVQNAQGQIPPAPAGSDAPTTKKWGEYTALLSRAASAMAADKTRLDVVVGVQGNGNNDGVLTHVQKDLDSTLSPADPTKGTLPDVITQNTNYNNVLAAYNKLPPPTSGAAGGAVAAAQSGTSTATQPQPKDVAQTITDAQGLIGTGKTPGAPAGQDATSAVNACLATGGNTSANQATAAAALTKAENDPKGMGTMQATQKALLDNDQASVQSAPLSTGGASGN